MSEKEREEKREERGERVEEEQAQKQEPEREPEQEQEREPEEEEAEAAKPDELTALRQALEEAQTQAAEYLDGWQRARAELANARKRFQREQAQAHTHAKADVLGRILPIVDDFDRAFDNLPDHLTDDPWIEGVELVRRKLHTLLEQDGVTPIEAVGREFDPRFHQAITHEPSEDTPEGHVIAEAQKGYLLGDLVLRPSLVRVSSGPAVNEPMVNDQ